MYSGISQSYHNYTSRRDIFYTSDTMTHLDMQPPGSTRKHTTYIFIYILTLTCMYIVK